MQEMQKRRILLVAMGGLMTVFLSAIWPLMIALALVFWLERNWRAWPFIVAFGLTAIADFYFWVV